MRAAAPGYFDGAAHSNFQAEGSSYVAITLMEKGNAQSFDAGQGGTLTFANDLEVNIPSGSMATGSGTPYNGSAEVHARWIDPTDDQLGGIMPGALIASDSEGNPLALETYGMVAIQFDNGLGTELDIAEGKEVQVEIPIPDELVDEAPDEIPLWYFDVEESQWLLEGVCNKQNGKYVCFIDKSGFWNCDIPLNAICLSGQVFNNDSTYGSYLKVIVEDLTNNFVYWGYTDSTGYFCGSVPQGVPLLLTIVDHCNNTVYTSEIGPFAEDQELEDIYLSANVEVFSINITGITQHCISADVPSGHVAVRYPGNLRLFHYPAGNYDFDLNLKCTDFPELSIRSYSASEFEATVETIHTDDTDLDIGLQPTCEELTDYFKITIDGQYDYHTAPTRFFYKENEVSNWLVLEGLSSSGTFTLDLIDYSGVGTYDQSVLFKTENAPPPLDNPVLDSASPNISVEITSDDGEFIAGQITGTAVDDNGATRDVTGDFIIRKAP